MKVVGMLLFNIHSGTWLVVWAVKLMASRTPHSIMVVLSGFRSVPRVRAKDKIGDGAEIIINL